MENLNKNSSQSPSRRPSTSSSDLSPLSDRVIEAHEIINKNIININNNINKPSVNPQSDDRKSSSSSELSPLSSLGHGSPPPEKFQPPPLSPDLGGSSPSPVVNRNVREGPAAGVTRVDPGGGGRRVRQSLSILRAAKREAAVRRAALGFRICGAVFCLISLSVMATDKNKGWALDSFYRYKEFRYCISVNVVGFLYSVAQTCDLAFTLSTGKYVLRHQYRFYFDFAMDQILTYLLMSASSSAATRVDDWESNWGKDEFPMMASVSVGLSFMSFIALAASTLISGYALCIWSSS